LVVLVLFVLVGPSLCVSLDVPELRLIQFNESYSQWMSSDKVFLMASECGTHEEGEGFMDITDHQELKASDLIAVPPALPSKPTHQTLVNSLNTRVSPTDIANFNGNLTSFFTRYYTSQTGKESAQWIASEFTRLAAGNPLVKVELFQHTWIQPSVIATITGSDPSLSSQLVILSAHEDSIVQEGSLSRAPGSDDDASGVSCLLEAFRVLLLGGYAPARTIEFHTYAAEEVGLRGSQAVASAYQKAQKTVYAQMQMDMTMYPGTPGQMSVIMDYTDKTLTSFVSQLVTTYSTLKVTQSTCGYACSDHASWYKAGYRASFPFEAPMEKDNPYIHTKNDLFSKLDVNQGVQFAKMAVGYAVELASSS